MKKFLIKWTENHEAIIEANNEDEAWDLTEYEDPNISRTATIHNNIECLGKVEAEPEFDQIEGTR